MPTYEYHCKKCQHKLEAFQKITEEPLKQCPQCSCDTLERGFGGGSATFCFKGSGFYITDYKDSPKNGCGCTGSHSCG